MEYAVADYVIAVVALAAAVLGIFNGFSGALAFFAALASGLFGARASWALYADWLPAVWTRALATLVSALVVFGLVRMLVRRMVTGLLKQPADSVFGFATGAVTGFLLSLGAAYLLRLSGFIAFNSRFVDCAESLFKPGI